MNILIKNFYIICLLVTLNSCLGIERSPKSIYYILPNPTSVAMSTCSNKTVITGPIVVMEFVTIPDYLNQSQIFIRDPQAVHVTLTEYNRWGEPLFEGCKRVLQSSISKELAAINGIVVNNYLTEQRNWTLKINILQFDGAPNDNVILDAIWTLSSSKGKSKVGHFTQNQMSGPTIADMVTTQGLLLEKLGIVIGNEIRQQLPYELLKK